MRRSKVRDQDIKPKKVGLREMQRIQRDAAATKALRKRGRRGVPVTRYDLATVEGQRELARAEGAGQLGKCVELWTRLVERGLAYMRKKGPLPEEYAGPVLRASENLANRCGLPMLSELSVRAAVPVKLVEARGPVGENGEVRVLTDVVGPEGEIAN